MDPDRPAPADQLVDPPVDQASGAHPTDDLDAQSPAPVAAGGQGRTLLVGGAVVLAVLVVAAVVLSLGGQDAPPVGELPQGVEGFGLTDAVDVLPEATLGAFGREGTVEVADLLGAEPLVLNFWATWCPPCLAEMPDLQALHEAGGGAFRLIGINTQDAAINAEPFIADLGVTYDQVVDRDGSYFTATGGFGMPTTLFVRPDGAVAHRHTGPLTLTQMGDLVGEHLGIDLPTDLG